MPPAPQPPTLTRRGFLLAVDAVGGATAYELEKAGYRCDTGGPRPRPAGALEQGRKIHGDAYGNEFLGSFAQHWAFESARSVVTQLHRRVFAG